MQTWSPMANGRLFPVSLWAALLLLLLASSEPIKRLQRDLRDLAFFGDSSSKLSSGKDQRWRGLFEYAGGTGDLERVGVTGNSNLRREGRGGAVSILARSSWASERSWVSRDKSFSRSLGLKTCSLSAATLSSFGVQGDEVLLVSPCLTRGGVDAGDAELLLSSCSCCCCCVRCCRCRCCCSGATCCWLALVTDSSSVVVFPLLGLFSNMPGSTGCWGSLAEESGAIALSFWWWVVLPAEESVSSEEAPSDIFPVDFVFRRARGEEARGFFLQKWKRGMVVAEWILPGPFFFTFLGGDFFSCVTSIWNRHFKRMLFFGLQFFFHAARARKKGKNRTGNPGQDNEYYFLEQPAISTLSGRSFPYDKLPEQALAAAG